MHLTGAFNLHIEPGTEAHPPRVSIILLPGPVPDDQGVLHLTPGCIPLDVEGCINALQDELYMLRADARRAFTVSAGHA